MTSEQIKADMKAATESGNHGLASVAKQGPAAGAGAGSTPPRQTDCPGAGQGGPGGRGARPGGARAGPRGGESGPDTGRNDRTDQAAAGAVGRATANGAGREGAPSPCVERGAGLSAGGAEPGAQLAGGEPRGTTPRAGGQTLSPSESLGGSDQPADSLEDMFVPRRPLTRSRSRMSPVPLVAEAGLCVFVFSPKSFFFWCVQFSL